MTALPPMTTTVTTTDAGFDVTVQHDASQSYSRAVTPRAQKDAKKHMIAHRIMRASLTGVTDLGTVDNEPARRGVRCHTIHHYEIRGSR